MSTEEETVISLSYLSYTSWQWISTKTFAATGTSLDQSYTKPLNKWKGWDKYCEHTYKAIYFWNTNSLVGFSELSQAILI